MRYLFLLSILYWLTACGTQPKAPVMPESPVSYPVETTESFEPQIDYDRLQTHLKMDRDTESLGYSEKSFATCEVGYGYPSNRNCGKDYFVLIHFQLMCRDSNQETHYTALGSSDMQALKGRQVKWSLHKSSGTLRLDDRGYGQIRTTAASTLKHKRLKINVGNDNLYMRASDINKVVTPSNWCE